MIQTKINKIVSIGLHTAVYLAFFLVQLFYNFDIASTAKISLRQTSSFSVAKNKTACVQKNASNPGEKTNFRLNKRFQPQAAPVWVAITTKVPVRYIPSKCIAVYRGYFIPAVTRLSLSLRGPPVVG